MLLLCLVISSTLSVQAFGKQALEPIKTTSPLIGRKARRLDPVGLTIKASVYLSSPSNCSRDAECQTTSAFALCSLPAARCQCDAANRYVKDNATDACLYQSVVGELCGNMAPCVTPHSICKPDMTNMGTERCVCQHGYTVQQHIHKSWRCVLVISGSVNENCTVCEANEGTCVDVDEDGQADDCICPSTRTGEICQILHVNVTCSVSTFSMTVCYSPHSYYNFSRGAVLLVEGYGRDVACKGIAAPVEDPLCKQGDYKLVLPLEEKKRQRCGTKMSSDVRTRTYENTLSVQHEFEVLTSEDLVFTTYCKFDILADTSSQTLGVISVQKDTHGVNIEPELTMLVEDQTGGTLTPGTELRLGDKVKLKIVLTLDGSYSAVEVDRCLASTSASLSDYSATTLELTTRGCPAPGQDHMTMENQWEYSDDSSSVETGLLEVFSLSAGQSLYIHCSVKLCLRSMEQLCHMSDCVGKRRRRRSGDSSQPEATNRLQNMTVALKLQPEGQIQANAEHDTLLPENTYTGNSLYIVTGSGMAAIVLGCAAVVFFLGMCLRMRRVRWKNMHWVERSSDVVLPARNLFPAEDEPAGISTHI